MQCPAMYSIAGGHHGNQHPNVLPLHSIAEDFHSRFCPAYCPGAFQGCTSLTAVVLPEWLISVGESAFAECSRLQQILFCSVACTLDSSETTFPEQAILVSEPNGSFRNYADTYQRSFVALPIAYGDVDDDGKIDVSDAVLILVAYAKSCADQPNSFSDRQKIAADYNQDGKIEVGDAVQVLTSYAKLAAGQQLP